VKLRVAALAVILAAPTLAVVTGGQDAQAQVPDPYVDERAYALVMEANRFNLQTWPDTPLLEAYEGERMRFAVHVPITAEMHTFHLHGHPWEDPDTGNFIDAVRLDAGETHRFEQTAGLGEGHSGDWFYHCHVSSHFQQGMWGVLRVYPYAMDVQGSLDALTVTLADDGEGLEDAQISAHVRDDTQVTPRTVGEGDPVEVDVTELGDGRYRVSPEVPDAADGQLVLTAHHANGESRARLDLGVDGYTLDRDVGPVGEIPETTDSVADPELELG